VKKNTHFQIWRRWPYYAVLLGLIILSSCAHSEPTSPVSVYPPKTPPTISITPTSGHPGAAIYVSGNSTAVGHHVHVMFDGETPVGLESNNVLVNDNGIYATIVKVPQDSIQGQHPIVVSDGYNSAVAIFTVE
jgi:hypothetical protein